MRELLDIRAPGSRATPKNVSKKAVCTSCLAMTLTAHSDGFSSYGPCSCGRTYAVRGPIFPLIHGTRVATKAVRRLTTVNASA